MKELTDVRRELRRRSLVAMTMLLSLVAALAVAFLTTTTRHVVVQEVLELDIPASWEEGKPVTPPPLHWQTQAIFQSGPDSRHTLTIAALDLGRPTATTVAMKYALRGLPVQGKSADSEPLQVGSMTGALHRAWSVIASGGQQYIDLHMIALLTVDGVHHHVIHLKKLVASTGARPNRLTFPNQTFSRILQSAVDRRLRTARPRQLAGAGLAMQIPQGLRAMVSPDHLQGDGVLLMDDAADRHVKTFRVLGIPDPGGTVPSDPLWPGKLLEARFFAATGRAPTPQEAGQAIEVSIPRWWVQFAAGNAAHGMVRRLVYYRFSEQRGLLVEAVCVKTAADAHWLRADDVARGIRTAIDTTRINPLVGVEGALRRGTMFRQRQQSMLTQLLKAGARPFLLSSPRGIHGYEIRQILQTNFKRRLPVAGIVRRRTEGRTPCERNVAWMAAVDGSECQWETRTACATAGPQRRPVHVRVSQLRIGGGQIALETAVDGEATTAWSTALPKPFVIPPMQDRWPAILLSNPESLPCLVWMCDVRHEGPPPPPMPVWIERQADVVAEVDPDGEVQPLVLRHRAMMALKADLVLLGPDGLVTRFVSREAAGGSAASAITLSETAWPELARQFRRNPGAWAWLRKLFDANPSIAEESR